MNLFRSWDWIYGRTPKFKKKLSIAVNSILNAPPKSVDVIDIEIETDGGVIQKVDIIVPTSFLTFVTSDMLQQVTQPYYQIKYSDSNVENLKNDVVEYFRQKFEDERLRSVLWLDDKNLLFQFSLVNCFWIWICYNRLNCS